MCIHRDLHQPSTSSIADSHIRERERPSDHHTSASTKSSIGSANLPAYFHILRYRSSAKRENNLGDIPDCGSILANWLL